MERVAHAVIGSNWGDEGKGLVTDWICRYLKPQYPTSTIVVRHNGGAQAGHTVQTSEGEHHIFHSYSAGSFAGATTGLGSQFVHHPFIFRREALDLDAYFATLPPVFAVHSGYITTHYDIWLNREVERYRRGLSSSEHGSCGTGVYETLLRNHMSSSLHTSHFDDKDRVVKHLNWIRDTWVPMRITGLTKDLAAQGIPDEHGQIESVMHKNITLFDDQNVEVFLQAVALYNERVKFLTEGDFYQLLSQHDTLIFEGAQGLALDQNRKADMPHLTPSNTGLRNVLGICNAAGVTGIQATYVTRAYLTRHGAGPLPGGVKDPKHLYTRISGDRTNVGHPFQGVMRYAPIDLVTLASRIGGDLAYAQQYYSHIRVEPHLAVTCMDHVVLDNGEWGINPNDIAADIGIPLALYSEGPTADDVTALDG